MSKPNAFEQDLLELIFNAVAIDDLADDDQSSPLTSLFVSLHTGDPGEAGDQTSSEASYTEYARQAVARTTGGWLVSSGIVSPVSTISFPQHNTTTTEEITHFGIGTTSGSGAGYLVYSGTIDPNISVQDGVTPELTTGTEISED